MRGYELADELDVAYGELKEAAAEKGHDLGHNFSEVDEDIESYLRDVFAGDGGSGSETDEKPEESDAEKSESEEESGEELEEEQEEESTEPEPEPETDAEEEMEEDQEEQTETGDEEPEKDTTAEEKEQETSEPEITEREADFELTPPMSVREVSEKIGVQTNNLIMTLMELDVMKTINDHLNQDEMELLASALDEDIRVLEDRDKEDEMLDRFEKEEEEESEEDLEPRAPVVTFLGHVDHGKTSILDEIRATRIAEGEAGGITQKVGASRINYEGKDIVFLDTPGHEAFTSMRARGANATDMVVLVVAADDGVMPQTEESINHARAAGVEIIVAINKIDKPNADIMRARQEVSDFDLIPEDWGGETVFVNTSAETGEGIDELLEMITLESELLEIRANPNKDAKGACLESRLDDKKGVTTTLLVQEGTLEIGDIVLCGSTFGRVKSMTDDRGTHIKKAGPSTPVVVLGLDEPPEAGEPFYVVEEEQEAREIVEDRQEHQREKEIKRQSRKQSARLANILDELEEGQDQTLNLVVKGGSDGAVEVLRESIDSLEVEGASIELLHSGVGTITESDVLLAEASNALVIGFQTGPGPRAQEVADENDIEIRTYEIIYNLLEDLNNALLGQLEPEIELKKIGQLNVKEIFNITGVGKVAGCYVSQGRITRDAHVKVFRDGDEIFDGELSSLKRFQEDRSEVKEGYECGVRIAEFDDIQVGDIIQAFEEEEVLHAAEA